MGERVPAPPDREAAVSDQDHDRAEAAQLPEGDLVAILLTQHATVRDPLEQVSGSSGQDRKQAFDRLAVLLQSFVLSRSCRRVGAGRSDPSDRE
jgi:hypothetical protein